jgi:hypothetical protein
MRIRVKHKPAASHWGATLLKHCEPGLQYAIADSVGLLLAEGWAEAVASEEPGLVIPLREMFLENLDDAIAADIAFDDAIAAAIERRRGQHEDLP